MNGLTTGSLPLQVYCQRGDTRACSRFIHLIVLASALPLIKLVELLDGELNIVVALLLPDA